jgi:putative DNA primase/helicase
MTNARDPYEKIASLVEGDSPGEDYASFMARVSAAPHPDDDDAPHPAGRGAPEFWQGDDDAVPPDDMAPADAADISPEIILRCASEPQNDIGNANRLLNYFRSDILNVRDAGWHGWHESRWRREGGKEIATMYAHRTAARIALEAEYITATSIEQHAIDEAAEAHADLQALGKVEKLTDDQVAKKRRLSDIVERGRAALAAIEARQIARRKYAVSSGNSGKIRGMLEQAEPYRTVDIAELDADKLAFNVGNGTLHFVGRDVPDPDAGDHSDKVTRKYHVELRPHNREEYITKTAPVDYNPKAKAPRFVAAITRFQPIDAVRSFLQRYHGYALTGLTGEQCLVFNYGTGANWKSTFVEVVARIMGDYCATIQFESIAGESQKSGSQASPDIARLPGARLVRASEPDRGVQMKEGLIKALTGGEPMLARHNFKDFFEFRPDFKLVLSGNHKLEIGGVDHGIWRRMRFVEWPVTIADNERRKMDEVMAELWEERAGILNWLVEGALDYLNNGLRTPKEVTDATDSYREENDPVGAFLSQCVVMVPPNPDGSAASTVPARQLYDAFEAWGEINAVRAWREKSFAQAMSQKGLVKERHKLGQRYLHMRLDYVPQRAARKRDDEAPAPGDDDVPFE